MCAAFVLSSGFGRVKKYLLFALCALPSLAVIFLQRDMGTLLIFSLIILGMLFCAGTSKRIWAFLIILSPAIGYIGWRFVLNNAQRLRIMTAADPSLDPYGVGYQQLSAKNAIASGGFTGRLFEDRGSFLFVSSAHNDFILSFIAQLFGTAGIFLVCRSVSLLIIRSAPRRGDSEYIYYLKAGAFISLASQAVINTAMNLSLFPVIGITLPFVSAGGTAMISSFAMLGLISLYDEENSNPKGVI